MNNMGIFDQGKIPKLTDAEMDIFAKISNIISYTLYHFHDNVSESVILMLHLKYVNGYGHVSILCSNYPVADGPKDCKISRQLKLNDIGYSSLDYTLSTLDLNTIENSKSDIDEEENLALVALLFLLYCDLTDRTHLILGFKSTK